MKSKKFKNNNCAYKWDRFKVFNYSVGSKMVLAKEGDVEKFNAMRPKPYTIDDVFDDDVEYPSIAVDTPFLTTKRPNGLSSHADQVQF
jgi:hypothetical protein